MCNISSTLKYKWLFLLIIVIIYLNICSAEMRGRRWGKKYRPRPRPRPPHTGSGGGGTTDDPRTTEEDITEEPITFGPMEEMDLGSSTTFDPFTTTQEYKSTPSFTFQTPDFGLPDIGMLLNRKLYYIGGL